MKKILIISLTNIDLEARVLKQVRYLDNEYSVHICGLKSSLSLPFYPITKRREKESFLSEMYGMFVKNSDIYYNAYDWQNTFEKLKNEEFDLIIAHEPISLPLAFKIKKSAKIVFDAHDYYLDLSGKTVFQRLFFGRFAKYLVELYAPKCDGIITVNEFLAKEYEKSLKMNIFVLTNAPFREDIQYSNRKNEASGEKVKLIYHGLATPARRIENIINAMNYLNETYELYLMLTNLNSRYAEKLKNKSRKFRNVHFVPPVSHDKVIFELSKYDIAISVIAPTNFNYAFCLPNKFYESIHSGLAVVAGSSPAMTNIVKKYNIGIPVNSAEPKEIALAISKIDYSKLQLFKQNSLKASKELCAEKDKESFLEYIESFMK